MKVASSVLEQRPSTIKITFKPELILTENKDTKEKANPSDKQKNKSKANGFG